MATRDQIAEQVELERDQIRLGLKRLRENTKKLEEKEYASAAVYGVASIDTLLPLVVARIEETKSRIRERQNGRAFAEIRKYLADVEPLAAAAISLKLTFDKVFSFKEGSNQMVTVCEAIGRAVEDECQMRFYEQQAPGLLEILKKNYWHKSSGTQQKVTIIRTLMNRKGIHWKPWGAINRVKLGGWLLDCIMISSNWFEKEIKMVGRKKQTFVEPTPEFLEIKDQVMHEAELFAPLAFPMLIEPNDWEQQRAGGYLLNEVMRGHEMVRRGNHLSIQGDTPIKFLNKIQKVGYKLNPFIVEVAEALQEKGVEVGKFIPIVEIPLPNKPYDIATNKESRHTYRREAAEVRNKNAQSFKRSCRTRMTMAAVKRFKDRDAFFIPHSFDYRGRCYPVPAFLTAQDTDFGKSLLQFAKPAFMTPSAEGWLAFQCATTYGLSKSPLKERLQWAKDNVDLITRVATDPLGSIGEWGDPETVDEPWSFLAAAEEYYHCVITADRQFTSLPVATDATCSGLQILAGLCRCKSTARMVNVLPSDEPQDAYAVVAAHAAPNVPESIRPQMDRKLVKRCVMTIPYNAKAHSNRQYIREELTKRGIEVSKEDLTTTVKAVRDAMDVIVPGPMAVMKWFETEVTKAIKKGATHLEWCTPSGFVVHQKLNKKITQQVDLQLLGRCRITIATEDSDKVDIQHHKNATAPNVIHSLDASLLHLAALRFDAPIALIHDSVLCRATDMSDLSAIVRETYMHLFAEHDYLKTWAEQIGAETEPPIIGDLEPETVIESTYFFC